MHAVRPITKPTPINATFRCPARTLSILSKHVQVTCLVGDRRRPGLWSHHGPPPAARTHELLGEVLRGGVIGHPVPLAAIFAAAFLGLHIQAGLVTPDHDIEPGEATPLAVPPPLFAFHHRTIPNTCTKRCVNRRIRSGGRVIVAEQVDRPIGSLVGLMTISVGGRSLLDIDGVRGEDGRVSQYPDYSQLHLTALTLREAVVRRPAMYFGTYPTADWPLVIAVWTATDLLHYAVGPEPQVGVTLHDGGDLSAEVLGARVEWPATAKPHPVEELVRHRMWWRHLTRSTTVSVRQGARPPAAPQRIDVDLVWNDLDILARFELDADLIGVAADEWWRDGPIRLRDVFATPHFRLAPGHRLTITDEATDTILQINQSGS